MKTRWFVPLCIAAMAATAAADWRDELSDPKPGSFPAMPPLRVHYKFGWTSFTAAEADFDYRKASNGTMRLSGTAKTVGLVRTLWRMDMQHTAWMQPGTLRPQTVLTTEAYRDETRKTKIDFTPDKVVRLRESNPPSGKARPKEFVFPNVYDLHSALHWVRSQRMAAGDSYKLVVYPATTPYLAQISVLGRQKVNAGGRAYNAIKLDLKLWHVTDELTLEPYSKFKRATVWISDDANRLLLKVEGEVFVGSVWAELDKVEVSSQR